MFRGFEHRPDVDATRRYGIAIVIAVLCMGGAAGAAVALSSGQEVEEEAEDVIEVAFEAPEKPDTPPPPPPPPPPVTRPEPRPSAAPPPPRLDAPPPPPRKIERDPLPTASPDQFQPQGGSGGDVPADMTAMDLGGGSGSAGPAPAVVKPPPPPPRPKARAADAGPIVMPEDATPPRPLGGNTPPEYPGDARAAGLEGDVFLKIVVNADGTVGDIEVKKGEEPFVSAAIAAVKGWRYSPALVDGTPTAVFRVIKVPFRLSN